jgi:hypothetical protein
VYHKLLSQTLSEPHATGAVPECNMLETWAPIVPQAFRVTLSAFHTLASPCYTEVAQNVVNSKETGCHDL